MKVITANLLNRFWTNGVKPIKTAVGTISSLTTAAKTNLVAAINEVKAKADSNATAITNVNNNLAGFKIRSGTVTSLTIPAAGADGAAGILTGAIDISGFTSTPAVVLTVHTSSNRIPFLRPGITGISVTQINYVIASSYTAAPFLGVALHWIAVGK